MHKQKRILGLIPARGGSKGLPGKNILPLAGKPLIVWSIEQALATEQIDDVIVSTENEQIAEIARLAGAKVPFLRPESLATDTASSIDVILDVLDRLRQTEGKTYDIVMLIEPTSPLRKRDDFARAIDIFVDNKEKFTSLISLGEIQLESPFYAKTIGTDGRLINLIENSNKYTRRQELPKTYFPYGVVYMSQVSTLRSSRTFYQEKSMPFFIERWQNYEIDDECDYICVGAILHAKGIK